MVSTYVRAFNESTLAMRSLKPMEKPKKGEKLVLYMSLLSKDASLMSTPSFARIDLLHFGPTDFFTGLAIEELLKPGKVGQEA